MQAYRLTQGQTQPEFQDVPEPAGPGQVVVRVAASGLCHTDFTVISRDRSYWTSEAPPFTLGHEILVDRYPLNAAKQAYDDFEHGRLVGRAVLLPAPSHTPAADGEATDSSRVAPVTAGL
jgi:Alcohol dehydrogenase GroES-like domain